MREHVQSTIKKNNEQYSKTTKSSEKRQFQREVATTSSDLPKLTDIISDQTSVVKRSKRLAEKNHMIDTGLTKTA